jgi:uncharacterized protein YcgL (UPF0745 family)
MNCFIYRCSRKEDMYLYLAEKDDYSCVPADIVRALGNTEFALELEITADTQLARENAATVMDNLESRGFHLQLPREVPVEQILARIAKSKD